MIRLAASGLSVRRGDAALIADVSLSAEGGAFIGLVGPNGAGKTTLLRALAGLEAAAEGRVTIDGVEIRALDHRARARKIAYLPQSREVAWAITGEAVASLGRFAYGAPSRLSADDRAAIDRALAATGADAFRTRSMTTLSGGEQARIHLARALAAETGILLTDEPTAALDPKHQSAIMAALRSKAEGGELIVAALHDLRQAQRHCTRIIALNGGRIAADSVPANALSPALVEDIFGVALSDI